MYRLTRNISAWWRRDLGGQKAHCMKYFYIIKIPSNLNHSEIPLFLGMFKSWSVDRKAQLLYQPKRGPYSTNSLGRRACKQQKTGMNNAGRVKDRLISSI